jgi:hypothetical protein
VIIKTGGLFRIFNFASMIKRVVLIILLTLPFLSRAQVQHSSFFGGSINYKGYQTGLGYGIKSSQHSVQISTFKNQSIDRLFTANHFALGLSYKYHINPDSKLVMGPEVDFQKMWLTKVGTKYNDSRIVSLAYFLSWNISDHVVLTNSIGTGGYIERFHLAHNGGIEHFKGVGGLIKLQCEYRF